MWPIGLIVEAMTSEDPSEIADLLTILKASAQSNGLIHESFWKDDMNTSTRFVALPFTAL